MAIILKQCKVKTTDNFYPNYPNNMVNVILNEFDSELDEPYRVLVSGTDDTMFEKFFKEKEQAIEEYNRVSSSNPIIKELIELGYKHF